MANEKNPDNTPAPATKTELAKKGERTVPGRFYAPNTDIYETSEELAVVMDMPGVEKENLEINLKDDRLSVEGRVTLADYDGLDPVYTEYNIGHYARAFHLSKAIDQDGISAQLEDGVLRLRLKKAKAAQPKRISVA